VLRQLLHAAHLPRLRRAHLLGHLPAAPDTRHRIERAMTGTKKAARGPSRRPHALELYSHDGHRRGGRRRGREVGRRLLGRKLRGSSRMWYGKSSPVWIRASSPPPRGARPPPRAAASSPLAPPESRLLLATSRPSQWLGFDPEGWTRGLHLTVWAGLGTKPLCFFS
jgi:hypothetical protein